MRERRLVHRRAAPEGYEEGAWLHRREALRVTEVVRLRGAWKGAHNVVRLGEEAPLVLRPHFAPHAECFVSKGVRIRRVAQGEDAHAKRAAEGRRGGGDVPEAQEAHCLATQLGHDELVPGSRFFVVHAPRCLLGVVQHCPHDIFCKGLAEGPSPVAETDSAGGLSEPSVLEEGGQAINAGRKGVEPGDRLAELWPRLRELRGRSRRDPEQASGRG
mmetsp:Transcript_22631/g.66725  ORF Transcript_22631/g.66725 Transcript_22631/m.66725 type:complete len:216 (+) Transcript_22631:570-1217(+)